MESRIHVLRKEAGWASWPKRWIQHPFGIGRVGKGHVTSVGVGMGGDGDMSHYWHWGRGVWASGHQGRQVLSDRLDSTTRQYCTVRVRGY